MIAEYRYQRNRLRVVSAERTCMPTQRGYLSIQQRLQVHALYISFIARLLARRLVWYARAINQNKHVFINDKHCCGSANRTGWQNRSGGCPGSSAFAALVGVYCSVPSGRSSYSLHACMASLTGFRLHDMYAAHFWGVQIGV